MKTFRNCCLKLSMRFLYTIIRHTNTLVFIHVLLFLQHVLHVQVLVFHWQTCISCTVRQTFSKTLLNGTGIRFVFNFLVFCVFLLILSFFPCTMTFPPRVQIYILKSEGKCTQI